MERENLQYNQRGEFNLGLEMFDPEKGLNLLSNTLFESGLLDKDQPVFAELTKAAQNQPLEFFMSRQGKQLLRVANSLIYSSIEDKFKLRRSAGNMEDHSEDHVETGFSFYRRTMNTANQAVYNLSSRLLPGEEKRYGLKNEVEFIPSPANLMVLLNSPQVDEKLKFELTRQMVIGLIVMQQEIESIELRERLSEIQRWEDIDLFNHGRKTGVGAYQEIHYSTDPNTNEVLSVKGAKDNPFEILPEDAVNKTQIMSMRQINGEIGSVLTHARIKSDSETVNKAIRIAAENFQKTGDSRIDPNSVVDRSGLLFIVANEFSNYGKNVDLLIGEFKKILVNRFNLDPQTDIWEDNNSNGYLSQSDKFKIRRLIVKFPDLSNVVEVMFGGIGDQLNNDTKIGDYDPKSGYYNGPAHIFYQLRRDIDLLNYYFPEKYYGKINFDEILRREYHDRGQKLLRAYRDNNSDGII